MRAIFHRLVREDLCKNLPFRKRTKQMTGGERGFCGEHGSSNNLCILKTSGRSMRLENKRVAVRVLRMH